MEKLENYRRILQKIINGHAQLSPSHGKIQAVRICDQAQDHYLLMDIGWDRTGRVYAVVFHIHIQDGKIWIEWDGTEPGIARELLEAGVPPEDIVLAYYRPERRAIVESATT